MSQFIMGIISIGTIMSLAATVFYATAKVAAGSRGGNNLDAMGLNPPSFTQLAHSDLDNN